MRASHLPARSEVRISDAADTTALQPKHLGIISTEISYQVEFLTDIAILLLRTAVKTIASCRSFLIACDRKITIKENENPGDVLKGLFEYL